MKNITSLAISRRREWKKKRTTLKKQLSLYKNILSEDLNIMKGLMYLSTSTAIKLYDVKEEARAIWA